MNMKIEQSSNIIMITREGIMKENVIKEISGWTTFLGLISENFFSKSASFAM
jgi:hypothetical protein